MKSKQEKEKCKRAYEKPRLRTIELIAGEVLAVGCKLIDGGSNWGATPCPSGSCSVEVGS